MNRVQAEKTLRKTLLYAQWESRIAWLGVYDAFFNTDLKEKELIAREAWIKEQLDSNLCSHCRVWLDSSNQNEDPYLCDKCWYNYA